MRKIFKTAEPQILIDNATTWTATLLSMEVGSKEFKNVESHYGADEIREALARETHRKCAYCESTMEAVSFAHVEHIQPKSRYRELTFAWQNLTLACQVCNTRKGDKDPGPTNFVHPYNDDVDNIFVFLGPFIAPSGNNLAARNMINMLDLNRTPLIVSRSEVAARVLSIFLEAIALGGEAGREFLELSLRPLLREEGRHSRTAADVSADLRRRYATELAVAD